MSRPVVVVAFDPIGESMAGPAIRAWHQARTLASAGHEVVLVGTAGVGAIPPGAPASLQVRGGDDLERLLAAAGAVVAPTSVVARHGPLIPPGTPLTVDLYIPTHLENLEAGGRAASDHARDVGHQVAAVGADLDRGDHFLCASERQRDFWTGALASAGRITPATYAADPTLRALIDVVPFGLPATPPAAAGHALRRRFDGLIGEADPVVVWGGGVYDWLDPLVVVRAADRLRSRLPSLRVVFLGMRNPHPDIPEMGMIGRLRSLAAELGLAGSTVLFGEGWVPLADWGATLLDADAAVSTHPDHVETRFSFRTRVLDYIWARRPMVLTGGDELSAVVAEAGVGVVVAPGDVDGVAAGLERVLATPVPASAWLPLAERYRWERVLEPLVTWAGHPRLAPDRADALAAPPALPAATTPGASATAGVPATALAAELGRWALAKLRRTR